MRGKTVRSACSELHSHVYYLVTGSSIRRAGYNIRRTRHDTCVRFTPIRARKSRFFAQRMNHATEVWKIDTRPAMDTSQLANLNSIPMDRIKKVWEWGAE